MAVTLVCRLCRSPLTFPEGLSGKPANCPHCGERLVVPLLAPATIPRVDLYPPGTASLNALPPRAPSLLNPAPPSAPARAPAADTTNAAVPTDLGPPLPPAALPPAALPPAALPPAALPPAAPASTPVSLPSGSGVNAAPPLPPPAAPPPPPPPAKVTIPSRSTPGHSTPIAPPVATAPTAPPLPPAKLQKPLAPSAPQRVSQTARFIAADPTALRVPLGADGKLPSLLLEDAEQATDEASVSPKTQSSPPWLLLAVFGLSVTMSLALLLIDTGDGVRVERRSSAAARAALQQHYTGTVPPLAPYQERVRLALQAYQKGDRDEEKRLYRELLDILHSESKNRSTGVTGMIDSPDPPVGNPSDRHLEGLISTLLADG